MSSTMDESRQQRLEQLRERILRGEYYVDPRAVADAIMRRWQERHSSQPGRPPLQNECS
jgi:anti-sigma28 factor (negative regulator of flagellin synthesis)